MRSSRSSPLGIVLLVVVLLVFFAPGRSTIPQAEADAIRARLGIAPGVAAVFYRPG